MSFDGQVVRPPAALRPLYERYVCLRITNMRGVNLELFQFDYDLTFSALLMNADGTVYHRFGGRDERGPEQWLTLGSLETLLRHTLEDDREYRATLARDAEPLREPIAQTSPARAELVLERVPSFKKRDKGECIHCHSIQPALYEEALAAGSWTESRRWRYSSPRRIGFDLDREDQARLIEVMAGSSAWRAGLRVGDRLHRLAGVEVMSATDVMFQLDRFPAAGGELLAEVEREGQGLRLSLPLAADWKLGTPLEFAWRPFKWGFTPAPGFGGRRLEREQLVERGLIDAGQEGELPFALRVTYLVTWGENQRYGRAAAAAGLREGDLLTAVAGKRDFVSGDHLHAWWRLTREAGEVLDLEIQREGKPMTLSLEVLE